MSVDIHRHYAAVRVYEPGRTYHLNFNRLLAAVELLNGGIPGRISEQLRERFPDETPQNIHNYFCAAQTVISHGINLHEVPE